MLAQGGFFSFTENDGFEQNTAKEQNEIKRELKSKNTDKKDKKDIFSCFSTDDRKVSDLKNNVVKEVEVEVVREVNMEVEKEVELNQWAASQVDEVKTVFRYLHFFILDILHHFFRLFITFFFYFVDLYLRTISFHLYFLFC